MSRYVCTTTYMHINIRIHIHTYVYMLYMYVNGSTCINAVSGTCVMCWDCKSRMFNSCIIYWCQGEKRLYPSASLPAVTLSPHVHLFLLPTHTLPPLSVCFFSNHAQLAVFWVAEPSLPLRFFTTSGKVSVDGREAALLGRNVAMSLCVSVSLRTMSLLSTLRTLESLGFQPSRSCSLKVRSHH